MNIPWWVFRIWAKKNGGANYGTPLNTFGSGWKMRRPGEADRLDSLIADTSMQIEVAQDSMREAERIVAYAWALYVFADPPMYNLEARQGKVTKFPLSSFIEVSQGYIVAAADGIKNIDRARGDAEKAFMEAMG
jgi:hypothetical protein